MKHIEGHHPPTQLVWVHEYKQLQADNARLTDLVTRFDTALRAIATESGMTEAYGGVDTEENLENFVKAIKSQRTALKAMVDSARGMGCGLRIADEALGIELRKIDLQTMADR